MYYTLESPRQIHATIALPSSKSISNRVLIMNQLAGGRMALNNLSDCDDTQVMLRALHSPSEITDVHAAGTAMRFLTAFISSRPGRTVMTGTERMKNRPIGVLVDALRSIGADIEYADREGFPPLRIEGRPLAGGEVSIAGNVSSQFISALMMIAPTMAQGLTLHITGHVASAAYIDMTAGLMQGFGIPVDRPDGHTVIIPKSVYRGNAFTVESDWSGASYWYEMLALSDGGHVTLPHLFENSLQGDAAVSRLFRPLGVQTAFTDGGVVLTKSGEPCTEYDADLENQPDLAQTLVVTCAMMGIPFHITGLQTLRIKETDRLTALRTELAKPGIKVQERHGDTLSWNGRQTAVALPPAIDTYEDHRMAMAFAPCAIRMPRLRINNPEVVSKSYPHYWDDLREAHFKLEHP